MKMIVSDASRNKVYHRSGCMYETRISFAHRMTLSPKKAMMYGYHECSCCGGLKGFMKVAGKNLNTMGFNIGFNYLYDGKSDTLYLRTDMGFWKIYSIGEMRYVLYHSSCYDSAKSFTTLMHGVFHRQRDVLETDSVLSLVNYVIKHDEAKKIMQEDYRNLPRRTKKQKRYYEQAKRKDRRAQIQRLDRLFDSLKVAATG